MWAPGRTPTSGVPPPRRSWPGLPTPRGGSTGRLAIGTLTWWLQKNSSRCLGSDGPSSWLCPSMLRLRQRETPIMADHCWRSAMIIMRSSSVPVSLAIVALAAAGLYAQAKAAPLTGTVEHIKVHGQALEGNLEGDSPDRDVTVYLPPSYATERARRYPVIYLLHGYGGTDGNW